MFWEKNFGDNWHMYFDGPATIPVTETTASKLREKVNKIVAKINGRGN